MKIEKGVPIPARGQLNDALSKLEVGDSFIYQNAASARASASKLGIKIAVRKEGDRFRVWRTA